MSITKTIKWFFKVLTAGLFAVVILSLFAYIYDYAGIHVTNTTGATDYVWRSNEIKNSMVEGFVWKRMDANGFSNSTSNTDDIDILILGSSHMEASQMSSDKNVGGLLNRYLAEMNTYNIGMSGHTIYRCVDNFSDAISIYVPKKYAIVETSTVQLDVENMRAVIEETAAAIPSYDSGLIYSLQLIPAFKPIYNQLELWMSQTENEVNTSTVSEIKEVVWSEYENTLKQFLALATDEEITTIIFYQPAQSLNPDGTVMYETNDDFLNVFSKTCESLGIVFVDMTKAFQNLYNTEYKLAHGFINTAIGAGHLNEAGHEVIARVLAETIMEMEEK